MSGGFLRSTVVVGANTGLSRVLGLVRDVVIARLFGAGTGADAFFVAFRIPNFLRRLFAEGAFAQAFVPILTEYKTHREHCDVKDLVSHTAGMLGTVLIGVTALGMLAAPMLVMMFAPGFLADEPKQQLTQAMLRLTFPYLLFISLTALAGAVLNTFGRFVVPAITPALLNLVLIGAAVWLAPILGEPVYALAIGVFFAGMVQLAFQFPALARIGMLVRPRLKRKHEGVARIMKLMAPAIFGVSVSQINLLFDTIIASFLVTGSVSWLYYSDRLVEFPLGVFGIALATVILPGLSRQHANADPHAFSATLDWALKLTLVIAAPSALGLALLSKPMLTTIFQYEAFTDVDARMAGHSLVAYAVGLPAFVAIKVLAPGYFSRQDTRTPVRIGVAAMLANIVLNLLLVVPLAHAGLALATSASAVLNAGLLFLGLRKQGDYVPGGEWGGWFGRVGFACGMMAAVVFGLNYWVGDLAGFGVFARIAWLSVFVLCGAGTYFLALFLCGARIADLAAPTRSA